MQMEKSASFNSNLFGSIREGAGAVRRLKESATYKIGYMSWLLIYPFGYSTAHSIVITSGARPLFIYIRSIVVPNPNAERASIASPCFRFCVIN